MIENTNVTTETAEPKKLSRLPKPKFGIWRYQEKQKTIVVGKKIDPETGKEIDDKEYSRSGRTLYGIIWTEPNGKIHKERSGLLTKTLAKQAVEQKRRAAQEAQAKGLETVEGPKAAVLLSNAAKECISTKSPDTARDYQSKLDNLLLPFFGNIPVATIKHGDVARFIDSRIKAGAEPATIRKDIGALSVILSDCVLKDYIAVNPVRVARAAKKKELRIHKKLVRFLSQDEEIRLYATLPPRKSYMVGLNRVTGSILRDVVPFAILTGLREMEIAGLTWADYDARRRVIKIMEQKNDNQDEVDLCDAAISILERLRGEATKEVNGAPAALRKVVIFRDPDTRQPLTRFNNTAWQNALIKAGIEDFRFHDCRHTFASRLAMAGASLEYIRRQMRHATIDQTMAYAHLCPEDNETCIDFKGRKRVALLDCYQDYAALLSQTDRSLELIQGSAHAEESAHATLPA